MTTIDYSNPPRWRAMADGGWMERYVCGGFVSIQDYETLLARCKALEEAMQKIDDETACDKRGPRENLIEIHRLARAALAAKP